MRKKGSLLQEVIIHLVLIGIILALFLFATAGKINGRGVRQQVLERQTALLVDAAVPGMSFEIDKKNFEIDKKNFAGSVDDVEIKNGRVFVSVAGLPAGNGYPYFSKYSVGVVEEDGKFVVTVR